MFQSKSWLLPLICIFANSPNAMASEASDEVAGINCFPAKKIVKMIQKFENMKPEHVDTVRAEPEMWLDTLDDAPLPDRVFYRLDQDETNFNLAEDGVVTDFQLIGGLDKKGDLCVEDKLRAGRPEDDEDSYSLGMKFDVRYQNKSGTYSLDELKDGLKDGQRHYKKMIPSPANLLVPSMTHIAITFSEDAADTENTYEILALKQDEALQGLIVEQFAGMSLISVEHLEGLGADQLRIKGGAYNAMPLASIDKLKKFGFVDESENKDGE